MITEDQLGSKNSAQGVAVTPIAAFHPQMGLITLGNVQHKGQKADGEGVMMGALIQQGSSLSHTLVQRLVF